MKTLRSLAFVAFSLSLGLAAFSAHAGPLAGTLGSAKEAALGGLHPRCCRQVAAVLVCETRWRQGRHGMLAQVLQGEWGIAMLHGLFSLRKKLPLRAVAGHWHQPGHQVREPSPYDNGD